MNNLFARGSTAKRSLVGNQGYYLQCPDAPDKSLSSIERGDLLATLAEHGAVLLRGFITNVDEFSRLVERVTPKTAIDPARAFFAKNVQLVDSGVGEIGLHCENGTTPLAPHIVWFYCERAASTGSQTTLCDGQQVWRVLSPRTKDLLLSNRIRFARNVRAGLWVKFIKHHFPQLAEEARIDQGMLDDVFGHIPGAAARLNTDGTLFLSNTAFAAHPTFFSDSIAFANSIFGPSYNYEAPKICFENDSPIPEWVSLECRNKADRLTTEIPWASGDIVMINNSRVMHGRRQIADANRKIYTALGFLSSEDKGLAR